MTLDFALVCSLAAVINTVTKSILGRARFISSHWLYSTLEKVPIHQGGNSSWNVTYWLAPRPKISYMFYISQVHLTVVGSLLSQLAIKENAPHMYPQANPMESVLQM